MKNTSYPFLLGCFLFLMIGANAQNKNLEVLLKEYQSFGNTPLNESTVLKNYFNEEESTLLVDFLSKRQITSSVMNRNMSHIFHVLNIRSENLPFGTLNGEPPFDEIDIITQPLSETCFAADFDDTGTLYAITVEEDPGTGIDYVKDLVTIDTTTGELTIIGDLSTAMGAVVPTGLAFDFSTSTMYASTSNGDFSNSILYTVDLQTAEVNTVGLMGTTGGNVIWIVIDNFGKAYAADVVDDHFYSVNLETGAATSIGPLGFDISFAQEATIDPATNILYMSGYQGGGIGEVHSVDLTTGEATPIGETTSLDALFGIFSIAGKPLLSTEDFLLKSISVYPNPASSILFVESANNISIEKGQVYDVLGRKTAVSLENNKMIIENLDPGVYFVAIETSSGTTIRKIIKE